jgi:hypothetical protein
MGRLSELYDEDFNHIIGRDDVTAIEPVFSNVSPTIRG